VQEGRGVTRGFAREGKKKKEGRKKKGMKQWCCGPVKNRL
jgi:hypothetical protein